MTHQRSAAQSRCGPGGIRVGAGPEAVRVWLLGGFRVSVGLRTLEGGSWKLRKARNLIKLLALAPHHRLHREKVMDALWSDLGKSSHQANNLHRTLHSAREVFEATPANGSSRYLPLRGGLLELCPDGPTWIDVEAFESAAVTARRSREPAAYLAALDLYAGELLPEDRYEPWAEGRRAELRSTYLSLLVELAELHEERAEYRRAIEVLRRAVSEEPAREEVHAGLMRLLALCGERGEALLQYEQLGKALSRELGAKPGPAARHLYEELRAGKPPTVRRTATDSGVRASANNLPSPLTSFVGREQEALGVKRLFSMTRLLTLAGAGGCGKTRLALKIARGLVGTYPDGVWLVELAALSRPGLVPRTVATALGVPERPGRPPAETLAEHLRSRETLLVLDNCEHLLDEVARLVGGLLGACPKLKVLASSREPLGVPGEAVWTVPPLSLPDADGEPTVEALMRCESVRLFVDRARSRLPAFELTEENAASTARVCRKLDGIPLAIELATARMGALAVEQVAARLEDSLGLLTGGARTADPRQQTMRATLRWSYELLSGPEKKLFARLSVFAGGWTLEAAEEVCRDGWGPGGALDLLTHLVDKSLVVAGTPPAGGVPRYRMLEPIRQYARERLEESGEAERLRELHAGHYLRFAEKAEPELLGREQVAWLERLATEYGNLRNALHWFLDEDGVASGERAQMGLRLAVALGRFWSARSANEGREWLEKGLVRCVAAPASLRANALREAGLIAVYHLDSRAIPMLEEALTTFRELGDDSGQATTINNLMHAAGLLNRHELLPTLRKETETLLTGPLDDRRAAAYLKLTQGMMAMIVPDPEHASHLEEALELFWEAGDLRSCAMSLTIIGISALGRGETERAERALEETLRLLWRLKDRIGTFYSLMGVAGVATLRGRPARAARLSGAAEALRKAIGHPVQPLKRVTYDYEGFLANTRGAMGEEVFEAAFREGLAMTPERAIGYALSEEELPPEVSGLHRGPDRPAGDSLTHREREVSLLICRGLTNDQIANELSISKHTVAAHVRKILKKLGLRSRTQVSSRIQDHPKIVNPTTPAGS